MLKNLIPFTTLSLFQKRITEKKRNEFSDGRISNNHAFTASTSGRLTRRLPLSSRSRLPKCRRTLRSGYDVHLLHFHLLRTEILEPKRRYRRRTAAIGNDGWISGFRNRGFIKKTAVFEGSNIDEAVSVRSRRRGNREKCGLFDLFGWIYWRWDLSNASEMQTCFSSVLYRSMASQWTQLPCLSFTCLCSSRLFISFLRFLFCFLDF